MKILIKCFFIADHKNESDCRFWYGCFQLYYWWPPYVDIETWWPACCTDENGRVHYQRCSTSWYSSLSQIENVSTLLQLSYSFVLSSSRCACFFYEYQSSLCSCTKLLIDRCKSPSNCLIRGPNSVWIRAEMNQDVFGLQTDTSGGLALLTYTNMYDSLISKKDPVTASTASYSVREDKIRWNKIR